VRRMTSLLTAYVRGKRKTLKYEFAVAAFGVWIAVTIRLFLSGDPEWIAAQGVNYATVTTSVFLFITAAVGIQAWQNTRPDGGDASAAPGYETGDQVRERTPEERARGAA
jgi:hypothetical protein